MTILYVENAGHRDTYRLNVEKDLDQLVEKYPQLEEHLALASDAKEAAEIAVEYLDSHNMDAWIEEEEIVKGNRDKLIAASVAVLAATPLHAQMPVHADPPALRELASVDSRPMFGKKTEDRFLWAIAKIESNNGQNVNHKQVTKGPQKGQTAIGRWGMLPSTVEDFVKREAAAGQHVSPQVLALVGKHRDEIEAQFFASPEDEVEVARMIARFVIRKQQGDLQRAAYAWLHGTHLPAESITDEQVQKSDYVQKFDAFTSQAPASFKERVQRWEGAHRAKQRKVTPSIHPGVSVVPSTPPAPKGKDRVVMALRAETERRRRRKEQG